MYGIDTNTLLYIPGSGPNNSPYILDSSLYSRAITAVDGAKYDTSQSVLSGGSVKLDGTNDCIYVADSDDWIFNDLTFDFRVRYNALPIDGQSSVFLGQWTDVDNRVVFQITNISGVYTYRFRVRVSATDLANIYSSWTVTPSVSTWYHVAFVKNGNNHYLFQNGTQVGTSTSVSYTWPNIAQPLYIGAAGATLGCLNGWLAEIRISKIARWISDFAVPTTVYTTYRNYLTHTGRNRFMMNGPMRGYQSV